MVLVFITGAAGEAIAHQTMSARTEARSPDAVLEEAIDRAAALIKERSAREAESARLTTAAVSAFADGRYREAQATLLEQREIDPDNFVVHYNLACARAILGDLDAANADLRRAVELGFANRHHLEVDPYLAPIRSTPGFRELTQNWTAVIEMQRRVRREQAQTLVRNAAEKRADEGLRIDVLSSHDAAETDAAMQEIRKVAEWATATLFPERADAEPFVVLALPDTQDFLTWAFWTYGERARRAFAGIGGAYEHDQKRLVAQDLGPTLRHEFFHVLHWRDMDRLGQIHPIWIQEGLASLVEDLDPGRIRNETAAPANTAPIGVDPRLIPAAASGKENPDSANESVTNTDHRAADALVDDAYAPVPSWRSNIVKRLARSGPLPPLSEFTALDHQRFSTHRPLAAYASARTIFLYLHDRGALERWYRVYTTDPELGYNADPSGVAAMEHVLNMPADAIEDAYREWVRNELPMVAETGSDLSGVLGVDIEQGEGSGPTVTRVPREARQRTGLRRLDIITAIDGRPVRDMKELIRVLSAYGIGETVRVQYTRVKIRGTADITLIARE